MKCQILFQRHLKTGIFVILFVMTAFSQDADIKNRFEYAYNAWKTYIEANKFSSNPAANKYLSEIVKLGVPVLPLIVEKMEKNETGVDFQLDFAFFLITRKIFEKEDWPEGTLGDSHTGAAMYANWWHTGIKDTPNSFSHYYQEWKRCLDEQNGKEAENKLLSIKKLGIAAMPYMIDKIKEDDLAFVKILSDFANGDLSENASKDECLSWWSINKEKYDIMKDK